MKQEIRIMMVGVFATLFLCETALAGKTNHAQVVTEVPTNVTAIVRSMGDAEKLKEKSPEVYFRAIRENARHLGRMEVGSDEEYQALFSSFTNLLEKPVPIDDNRSSEMLSLQSHAVKDYMRNDRIKNDKRVWVALAQYIGEIRSQLPPPRTFTHSSTNFVMPSSMEEWRRGRARGNYQLTLKYENRSLTLRLMIYMESLPKRDKGEGAFFQQLADVANLTEEERAKLGKR